MAVKDASNSRCSIYPDRRFRKYVAFRVIVSDETSRAVVVRVETMSNFIQNFQRGRLQNR
ncbi:uncharacterized protein PADG_11731 [Paracoccidioides brasiliensis Pb18]|uniref:Uncharacterized protein n=1 Tax=Paracoccidioides brasiliensis (strain Pb18) TaxID=502780 RepID=A0A0A0HV35_PARBD|nr:uncharacterized protein PADG_11731 [Paracoccidioides brasiliensis Pb18]KGM92193.1 hypothetical protein PADG_11731 [Paracoccidioides brasiliensis Pb18]